jgi:hypothetical protein
MTVLTIFLGICAMLGAVCASGLIVGLFIVEIPPPTGIITYVWSSIHTLVLSYNNFSYIYFRPSVLIAVIIIIMPIFLLYTTGRRETKEELAVLIKILTFFALFTAVPYLAYDYAGEIYPNIRYNLGGGQPQIAQLILTGKKSDFGGWPATFLCYADTNPEQAVKTGEIAIWYQSDKFIYTSCLSNSGATRVKIVATDLKLVSAVEYLPKHVKVSGGSVIDHLYPDVDP